MDRMETNGRTDGRYRTVTVAFLCRVYINTLTYLLTYRLIYLIG